VNPEKVHSFFEILVKERILPPVLGKFAHIRAVKLVCQHLDLLSPKSSPGGFVGEKVPDFFHQIEEWFVFWSRPELGSDGRRFLLFPSELAHALAYTWSDQDCAQIARGDVPVSTDDWIKWLMDLSGPAMDHARQLGAVNYIAWQQDLAKEIVQSLDVDFPQVYGLQARRCNRAISPAHEETAEEVDEEYLLLQQALAEVQQQREYALAHMANLKSR
jgi:hypothetical protein